MGVDFQKAMESGIRGVLVAKTKSPIGVLERGYGINLVKTPKSSPAEADFLFEIDPEPAAESLTSFGGAPLLLRTLRSLGVPESVARHIKIKQRQRGYDEATFVESFVLMNGVGGDCLDDFDRLRADRGLEEMLGHAIPSPEAARKFLYEFHSEENIETARQQRGLGEIAYIPGENAALRGLGEVNRDLVREVGRRCADQKIATVDQDATIIESRKQEALRTYEGERGYQPMRRYGQKRIWCWPTSSGMATCQRPIRD